MVPVKLLIARAASFSMTKDNEMTILRTFSFLNLAFGIFFLQFIKWSWNDLQNNQ